MEVRIHPSAEAKNNGAGCWSTHGQAGPTFRLYWYLRRQMARGALVQLIGQGLQTVPIPGRTGEAPVYTTKRV